MNIANEFSTDFSSFIAKLDQHQVRNALVLTGVKSWREKLLGKLLQIAGKNLVSRNKFSSGIWVGKTSPIANLPAIEPTALRQFLGQELDFAVFCAEQGIGADSLAIVAGMLKAGGILWILLPDVSVGKNFANPANQKFLSYPFELQDAKPCFETYLLENLTDAIWIEQQDFEAGRWPDFDSNFDADLPNAAATNLIVEDKQNLAPILTEDQQHAEDLLLQLFAANEGFHLLLEADRGRGKSSLLGFASAKILADFSRQKSQNQLQITITAARFDQAKIAFEHCKTQLQSTQPGLVIAKNKLLLPNASFSFKAADDLILNQHSTDLLLIDEAAHLPLPILQKLSEKYPKIVFASTLQGYEGSGQGINLRLKKLLASQPGKFEQFRLQTPVRWAQNDPLESLINQLLLLDSSANNLPASQENLTQLAKASISKILPENLSKPELTEIFALLNQAHYQSTPADLQHLLAAPDLHLFVARAQPGLVGVLLVADEGNLPVLPENRRVKGHLVAQLLRMQTKDTSFVTQKSQRALRIAVIDEFRRQKIASQLVNFWQEFAKDAGKHFISVSFGDTEELTNFWQKLGFVSQHLGQKQNKASGKFNRVMIKKI